MGKEMMEMFWTFYIGVAIVLFLNSLSVFVYNPSKKTGIGLITSLFFIPFWGLTIFSPDGRHILFNRAKQL